MAKIMLKGFIEVPPEEIDIIKKELNNHISNTRSEEGCITFNVDQNSNSCTIFNVYEEFVNREAFEIHQERVKNSYWGKITKNIKRSYDIKEII